MGNQTPRLGAYRLQDHHLTQSRGNHERLEETLCALAADINMGAEFLAHLYRVDAASLWPLHRLRIEPIDGAETIVLAPGMTRRTSDEPTQKRTAKPTGVDLLAKFENKSRPAAAAMGYFMLAMERRAQRLSKRHQELVRRTWNRSGEGSSHGASSVGIDDDRLLDELSRLSEQDIAITRLCIIEGRTQAEAARILGSTRPRVQKAIKAILTKLKTAIRQHAR
ncbi:MAG: sigma-70 family RNA polymerase sigma factor [Phycisphaerales bacterium]|nr:sigma-70 family RNA polymerase sigma factor [Phycisphaerales bacterium]